MNSDTPRHKPRILRRRTLARTRLFHVEGLALRFPNGVEVEYERLHGNSRGAVLVVPLLDEDTVLLIREYAAGVERYELALPKGKIEGNESPEQAAGREIMEEVGHGARRLTLLRSLTTSPGYMNHHTHVVLAQDLYPKRLPGDEPEPLEVIPWRLSRLSALLEHPECTEARSIAALFLTREYLQR